MKFWCLFVSVLLLGVSAMAGEIKAIVNDTPISAFDVNARAKMMMLQQAGQVGKLTASLKKTALEDLIEEQIKLQEAGRVGIVLTSQEISDALAHLEKQNGLEKGGFKKILKKNGIPYQTLESQTKANLGWLRVLQKSGRMAAVTPADVKARKEAIRRELGKESLSLAEIVLQTEDEALSVWQRLQGGADFQTMVELYSTADSRLQGGKVTDAGYDYYGDDGIDILKQMQAGQLSRPIPVPGGYAIVLMLHKRPAIEGDTIKIWHLMQAIVPPNSVAATLLKQPMNGGCRAFVETVKEDALPGSFQQGEINPEQLPADIKPMLSGAPFQKVIGPLETPAGFLFFMKCAEKEENLIPTDEALAMQIETEKMELISRQLISELKRDVVIEYK